MDILNSKFKYGIIGGLIVIVIILYIAIQRLATTPSDETSISPTPTEFFPPTITPVQVRVTVPPLSEANKKELQYPVKFEEITVVYKSNSGTFLIYHLGDPKIAEASFERFMQRLAINPSLYLIDYRSLEPGILPDRGFPQGD